MAALISNYLFSLPNKTRLESALITSIKTYLWP